MTCVLASARAAGLFSAAIVLVDRRPGATLCLILGHATAFLALFDVLGLADLLVGIFGFIALWHGAPLASR